MTNPIAITIPHQLGRIEARRRIEAGFASTIGQLPGGGSTRDEHWEGDRLSFSVTGMGQSVVGVVDVLDAAVALKIELPGMLGIVAYGLAGRVHRQWQLLLTRP